MARDKDTDVLAAAQEKLRLANHKEGSTERRSRPSDPDESRELYYQPKDRGASSDS